MTKEILEKAKMLERSINHIKEVIDFLSDNNFQQDPPTRQSGFRIRRGYTDYIEIELNEGEAVYLIEALKIKKTALQRELEML